MELEIWSFIQSQLGNNVQLQVTTENENIVAPYNHFRSILVQNTLAVGVV